MVTGVVGHGLILNIFLEIFNTCFSWVFVVVLISGMFYGLIGKGDKISAGFMVFW